MKTATREEEIVGQYASDHYLLADNPRLDEDSMGVKDVRGDGSTAFHNENVFGQNEADPDDIENLLGYGEGLHVEDEARLFGRGVKRLREPQADAADDWMRKNGHRW